MVREKADIMVSEGLLHPTTFEIITAIAFLYYKEENVDYVILEVGLGGRYDSTNIIDESLASVITTIDYDHIEVLGDTLGKIAYQKSGIIKKNGIVVSYPQNEEALQVLKDVSKEMNAKFYLTEMENVKIKEENNKGSVFDFKYNNVVLENLKISLLGEYQIFNASLAVTTLIVLRENKLISISDESIYKGLMHTRWKGRLEVIRTNPTFLIDGAHNVQGINQLTKAIDLFKYNRLILGIGVDVLIPKADEIVVTEVDMPRKLSAEDLGNLIRNYNEKVYVEKNIKNAVLKAFEIADEKDLIVFGGSLYLIGEVRKIAKQL